MLELSADFARHFPPDVAFDRILDLQGATYRQLEGRRTFRFELDGKGYFAKIHLGIGWKEILKNLFSFRLPVLGAKNEHDAILRLEELGVSTMTMVAYGVRGWNPAKQQSFVITEELTDTVSLEDFCRDWPKNPPPLALKRDLIRKVASIARTIHTNGVNHRDFYICHFLLDRKTLQPSKTPELFLIDLHRVQIRRKTPRRWVVKDVAGLYFSSRDIGLTRRDVYRFIRIYSGKTLRVALLQDGRFWSAVQDRGDKLYRRIFG